MVFQRTLPFMVFFCLALIPQSILAQQKIPIEVSATSYDTVGKRLVYKIKEGIRRSATFEITLNTKLPRLKINIVTLDPYEKRNSDDHTGYLTIYSLVTTVSGVYFDEIYITSAV